MNKTGIRILIADDHQIVREGLRLIIETQAEFEVVGEATDGNEAIRLADDFRPDVILMDLRMPGMDGLTAIEKLRQTHPEIAVVILTTYNEDDLMMRGLSLGARGYLLKDSGRQILFETIRAAARGDTLLKPEILARVLAHTAQKQDATAADPDQSSTKPELSERELEVLSAVAQGERNKEIAYRLGISERTVKAHLASVFNKLGVDSRAAAIAIAAQRGWI